MAIVDREVQGQPPAMPSLLVGQPLVSSLPDEPPASLSGTSVPSGWARVDASGSLIPTPALRQLFEYYLSALGEESMPQLVARIQQALARLQEPARSEALDTLGAYLDYKLAVAELEASYGDLAPSDSATSMQLMQEVHALRRTWMDGATVEAFFFNDEAVDRFQVAQQQIARDNSLTDSQRAEALARAEQALPDPIRTARRESRRFEQYEQVQQSLANDPEALSAWRTETFGTEAAARLAELEQSQKDWDRRWQTYSEAREALLDSSGLAAPELERAVERLRSDYFSESELVRAEALDSIR
ncbi:lipase secretion chaperone [Marinobacter salinexigens]|nr:lipase secretion chaperone [Marinobacter salinexigens]